MKKTENIYNEVKEDVLNSGNHGLKTMAKIGIEKAQKHMFYYIYELAEKEHDNGRILEFLDKLDGEFDFE